MRRTGTGVDWHSMKEWFEGFTAHAQSTYKNYTKSQSNRSYLYKSFYVWRSMNALSGHLAAHNMGQVHDVTQHKMVLDIQKTDALKWLIQQVRYMDNSIERTVFTSLQSLPVHKFNVSHRSIICLRQLNLSQKLQFSTISYFNALPGVKAS